MAIQHSNNSSGIGDLLERILDKGIVIAGDIKISLADVELLNIKIRLLVASVDKAKEMGIDWWAHDPYLSSRARVPEQAITGNTEQVITENTEQVITRNEESVPIKSSIEEVAEASSMVKIEKELLNRPKYRN
ncbi:gas vesicle protein [Desulfosporosinus sp. BG]|uniref:gas vesicle protein n=1 Tax=Desulfosporosinus sp. BG TaxID=1633135 RepID=UPI00083B6A36|nr:putative gas vesicle synthesis protein [Desulfosporosinus sp. BG]